MASVINTNMASLTAQRNLSNSQNAQTDAMARLSSGLRINSAKDDAAGLAISTRFSSQTQGLAVAIRNAGDGISLAQTAEGALGTMTESLQRVRELALQAANGTNSDTDREALNAEAQQMIAEVTRTAEETNFNGQKLLNGDFDTQFQIGANAGETIGVNIASVNVDKLGVSAESGVSAVGTNEALGNGDLVINGVSISSSSAADDDASTQNKGSSAIAKVAAVNKHSGETGVRAVVDDNVAAGSTQVASDQTGTISLNGVEISVQTTNDASTTRASVAAAINAESDRTGVKAIDTGDLATGVSLIATDGRNIDLDLTAGGTTTLNAENTGLAGDGVYSGGFTLVAEGDTKEIDISGGNGTGNGDIRNSGLSEGTYAAGVSSVSSSAVAGDASVGATSGSGALDLSSLAGTDYTGSPVTLQVTIDGAASPLDIVVNGDLSTVGTRAAADLNLSSVYGNDYSGVGAGASFTVDIDTGAPGASTTVVALTGDYRTAADSVNGGINGILATDIDAIDDGTGQTITVDGNEINFTLADTTGMTDAQKATSLQTAINSGIAQYNVSTPATMSDVTVEAYDDGGVNKFSISSGTSGFGSVSDTGTISATEVAVVSESIEAHQGKVLNTDNLIAGGSAALADDDIVTINVNGVDYTGDVDVGGTAGSGTVDAIPTDSTELAAFISGLVDSGGNTLGSVAAVTTDGGGNIKIAGVADASGNPGTLTAQIDTGGGLANFGATEGADINAAATDADLLVEINAALSGAGLDSIVELTPGGVGGGSDGQFTLLGGTTGSTSSITVSDGDGSAGNAETGVVASNVVAGTDSVTDAQILAALDISGLGADATLIDGDAVNNDGKFTLSSATTGVTSTVALSSAGGTGVTLGGAAAGDEAFVPTERNLDAGDLVINNVAIKAAQVSDDVASYSAADSSSKTASGIAKAAAVNKSTGETGVTATVNDTEFVGGKETEGPDGIAPGSAGALGNTGAVWVNGVEVSLTVQGDEGSSRAHAVDQINSVSGQTGVTASDNGKSLSLTASDGRNIVLAFDTNSGNTDGGVDAKNFGLGNSEGVSESDITGATVGDRRTASDAVAKTTYSTVTLGGAGDIEVSAGINGNEKLSSLGFNAGTYGGGEDGTFLKDIDLSTVEGATAALSAIDNALDSVNSQRAELGAIQNRFETTVKNLQVSSENLTAANSRIRDADFAAETAELSRAQVLQQAGTSILAQANALPQQVLSLLQ